MNPSESKARNHPESGAVNPELFTRAKWWLSQGVELVPIQSKSKALVKGYGAHSKHITNEPEAWLWFTKLQVNLGVVCGGSTGLTCIDFDVADTYDQWRLGPGHDLQTRIEKTARGYHVYVISEPVPSILTARVELKGSGVVMVAPSIHPSGQRYETVAADPITRLTPSELKTFFPFVSDIPPLPGPLPQMAELSRHTGKNWPGNRTAERIKAAHPVSEEARKLTDLRGQDGHYYGRCPFHDDKHPSLWVDDEAGIWACRSPSCPTNAGQQKAHDVINLRAWAQHISNGEAIIQLAQEVLPPWPPKPTH